ncbi:MAG: methylmalonyl-CoA epimerase [Planctomycetes bacterium]|nr:methylmalonyl-CoA epimerase [Planctomycetota bacterium]
MNYIDHVGVAVEDIDAALDFFQQVFGAPPAQVEELPDQGVRATLIQVGQTRLELLEPMSPDSAVGRFIQSRGQGLHHLALNVSGIQDKLDALDRRGLRLVDKQPRHGLSGNIAFVHPSSVFGVLTELVESFK